MSPNQIIFHNDIHSLLRNPPYKLTLTVEELIKPSQRDKNERDSDNNKVPRPPNGYILYRKDFGAKVKLTQPKLRVQDVSKLSALKWREENSLVKSFFKILAEIQVQNHNKEYPNYKYNPTKNKRNRKGRSKRARTRSKKLNNNNNNNNNKPASSQNFVSDFNNIENNNNDNDTGDNINNNTSTMSALSKFASIVAQPEGTTDSPRFFLLRRGSLRDELLNGKFAHILNPSSNNKHPESSNQHLQPSELLQDSNNLIPQSSMSEFDVSFLFPPDLQNYDFDFTIENNLESNNNGDDNNNNSSSNNNNNNNNGSLLDSITLPSNFMQWDDFCFFN